jgi:hypothetical protein
MHTSSKRQNILNYFAGIFNSNDSRITGSVFVELFMHREVPILAVGKPIKFIVFDVCEVTSGNLYSSNIIRL